MKSLTTLTMVFYFTTINPRDRTTLTRLLYPPSIFLPRNFSVSIKFVCATVRTLSGSSMKSYMLYYPKISVFVICVEAIIYLLLYNLHDCTFNRVKAQSLKFDIQIKILKRFKRFESCM